MKNENPHTIYQFVYRAVSVTSSSLVCCPTLSDRELRMLDEFVLQKRTLSNWSYVTWYRTEEEAKKNFDRVIKGDTGYSWRVVKLTTIYENLLDGERDNTTPEAETEEAPVKTGWGTPPAKASWASPVAGDNQPKTLTGGGWGDIKPASAHGLSGSVWVINKTLKQKKRVSAAEADKMLQEGWERGGPKTVV